MGNQSSGTRANPAAPNGHHRLVLMDEARVDGASDPLNRDVSAAAGVGRSLFVATDEGATVERLVQQGDSWTDHVSFPLGDLLDLPDGRDGEMDIEGLTVCDGYMWVVGSHSLKRKKAKPGQKTTRESLQSLAMVSRDPNRYTLSCIPLVDEGDEVYRLAAEAQSPDEDEPRRAGSLPMRDDGSTQLARSAARDPLFGRFMDVPSKENGFDIEGLEVVDGRAFLGLRGPVLRGLALVLEVWPKHRPSGQLRLRKLEDGRYRRHFLDLDGLGVRDLLRDGDDLLLLAGPTLDVGQPVRLFRWRGFADSEGPSVVGDVEWVCDLPSADGYDHAEALAWVPTADGPRLLVGHDDPAPWRVGDGDAHDELRVDIYDLAALRAGPSFHVSHVGGGWYDITAQGLVVDRLRGSEMARDRVAELEGLQHPR